MIGELKRKARNIIASMVGLCLITLGFVKRAKQEILKNNYITGIYFHNPSKRLFEKCVKWLINNKFTIITSNQLIDIIQGKIPMPLNAVWLSIDDGWKENMTNVLPFAVENKIPITFYISTEPVEFSGFFWWTLAEKFQYLLPMPYREDLSKLWKIPEIERLNIINEVKQKMPNGYFREAMNIQELKEISIYDFLTIGSHTVNHVITINCSNDELDYELSESKKKLEYWTGKTVNTFSYPNGDYSGKEISYLMKNGYVMAAVQDDEFITSKTNIYKVPRFSIGEGFFPEELCHMLGVWQKIMKKMKRVHK